MHLCGPQCNSQQFTQILHSGRTIVAGFGKSFGMGYTMGGNSTSITSTVNEYFLEIRYQTEKNGMLPQLLSRAGASGGTDRVGLAAAQGRRHRANPGTKRRTYLEENVGAAAIQLSGEDMRGLEQALREVSGPRYNERQMAMVDR